MKRLNFIILLMLSITFLSSCKDEEKYRFIFNFMNFPDSIDVYLKNSKFNSARFKEYLKKDSGAIKFYKQIVNESFNNGYEFYHDFKNTVGSQYGDCYQHTIIIKGKNDEKMKFIWEKLENGDWELRGIDIIHEGDPDYYKTP